MRHLLLGLAVLLVGCGTARFPLDVNTDPIPEGAETVIVNSQYSKLTLYSTVNQLLQEEGYTIATSDEAEGTITTEFTAVQDEIPVRITATITTSGMGTQALFRGEWRSGYGEGVATETLPVRFEGQSAPGSSQAPPSSVAYAEMVRLAQKLPHRSINFAK